MVRDGAQMARALIDLKNDAALRESLVRSGLEIIRARHTCAHRVEELLNIVEHLRAPVLETAA
jgi:spore maturation protein CgeB